MKGRHIHSKFAAKNSNTLNLFKFHFNRLFLYSFSNVRIPYNTSRVCRKVYAQIVEKSTFMNGGNFKVDSSTSCLSPLGSMLSVMWHRCVRRKHGMSPLFPWRESRLAYIPSSEKVLTISVLQAYCAMTTEYGIPCDFVRKSSVSLQIKISAE